MDKRACLDKFNNSKPTCGAHVPFEFHTYMFWEPSGSRETFSQFVYHGHYRVLVLRLRAHRARQDFLKRI